MKYLHNVEKSAFRPGEYVGYADGVWRIVRNGRVWIATHRNGIHKMQIARTLAELSELIDECSPYQRINKDEN